MMYYILLIIVINTINFPSVIDGGACSVVNGKQQDGPNRNSCCRAQWKNLGRGYLSFHLCCSPMCLTCCPTVLPLTSEVTRRLLSQWPPLNSSLPSWETTKRLAVTSTPGAKGPDRKRWVLEGGSSGKGVESNLK